MKIGAQLYTVRDVCKDQDQTAQTLKRIADIGYTGIQWSGIGPFDPSWIKETCETLGLQIVITHNPAQRLQTDLTALIAEHDLYHCRYMGLGAMDNQYRDGTLAAYHQFVETFKPITQQIAAADKLFMYHNHGFEWQKIEGKLLIDRMIEDFTPEEMGFTLDVYWVQAGGGDPAVWLEKLAGRIPCIHYKDMLHTNTDKIMVPVMRGNLNWERIIDASLRSGVEWAFVEQDNCNGEDPLDCLAESYRNLTNYMGK